MSDDLTRTVCVKLDVRDHGPLLSETAAAFNAAATWIARVCWDEDITNSMTAHFRVYGETRRRFGLGAQLAESARAKAMEALKAERKKDGDTCPTFGPQGSVRYDARTYHRERAERLPGVDLGIATDSTGEPFTGEPVTTTRERRFRQRQRLQAKNTRRARARLRRIARREARFQRDINHIVSKALVGKAAASCKALALEDLRGLRERVQVRHEQRRQHNAWAFSQLRNFVAYKAAAAGVRVVYVDPRNTSRTCSACGYCDKGNRPTQAHFRCLQCEFTANADLNGALNIAHRTAVNQPIVLSPAGLRQGMTSTSPQPSGVGC